VNHKKVLRLMRESDLFCRVKRKWVKTTDSKHHFPRYHNLIKDDRMRESARERLDEIGISPAEE